MKKKAKVGDYTAVKMSDGSYKICRVLDVYQPGESKMFCGHTYTNQNSYPTFYLDWGGISVPNFIFRSKREADLWMLETKFLDLTKELELEREAHKRTKEKLYHIRKVISKL